MLLRISAVVVAWLLQSGPVILAHSDSAETVRVSRLEVTQVGVGDSITTYLPELARRDACFSKITIRDLLRMSSGLRYVEDAEPRDDRRTYMDPNLRQAGLDGSTVVEEPGNIGSTTTTIRFCSE